MINLAPTRKIYRSILDSLKWIVRVWVDSVISQPEVLFMAAQDWDVIVWRQAKELLQQAERIQRNFLQFAVVSRYRATAGRSACWEPLVNVVETDASLWVVSALAGVTLDRIQVRFEENELVIAGDRPLPECCAVGQLKLWEMPVGRFERRLRLAGAETLQLHGPISFNDGLLIIELRKQS